MRERTVSGREGGETRNDQLSSQRVRAVGRLPCSALLAGIRLDMDTPSKRTALCSSPNWESRLRSTGSIPRGHVIRMVAARWLGLPPAMGRFFYCRPASVGVLGFKHKNRDEPIIGLWNFVVQPRE